MDESFTPKIVVSGRVKSSAHDPWRLWSSPTICSNVHHKTSALLQIWQYRNTKKYKGILNTELEAVYPEKGLNIFDIRASFPAPALSCSECEIILESHTSLFSAFLLSFNQSHKVGTCCVRNKYWVQFRCKGDLQKNRISTMQWYASGKVPDLIFLWSIHLSRELRNHGSSSVGRLHLLLNAATELFCAAEFYRKYQHREKKPLHLSFGVSLLL